MKYFVGTAVGKKDFNRVGKCTRDCTGRCSFDFFFHSCCECYAHALTAHNAFFSSCGKNVLDLPWQDIAQLSALVFVDALPLLCVDTDSVFDVPDILVYYI